MTAKKKLKLLARERMARTGESYTTALAAITAGLATGKELPEPAPRCCCEERPGRCPIHRGGDQ